MNFNSKYLKLLGLHILIAILIFVYLPFSKIYFAVIVVYFFVKIISSDKKNRINHVLIASAYVVGSEVFLRMTGGNFLYEASKYLVILYIFTGMLFDGIEKKSYPYLIYLFLLIPGIFVMVFSVTHTTNFRTAIAFNLSGPVCLGLTALYCYNKRLSFGKLQDVLLALLLPIISTAIYLFLYTPDIRDVLSGTQSNFEASGGFGPNQVATVLGLGMLILTSRYFMLSSNLIVKVVNLSLLVLVTYRGIVTFSRGGIFVGIIMIVVFLYSYFKISPIKSKFKIISSVYLFFGVLILAWFISSSQTMGLIDKRYANQDAAGRTKEDISTGRSDLISFEINEFLSNPFFGVGVGKIKEIRYEKEGLVAASHNEMSRIIAEHGLFGVVAFIIILITPLIFRLKHRNNIFFYSFYLFWFLTINHSSMRIAAPAYIYGLCLLKIKFNDYRVVNKRSTQLL